MYLHIYIQLIDLLIYIDIQSFGNEFKSSDKLECVILWESIFQSTFSLFVSYHNWMNLFYSTPYRYHITWSILNRPLEATTARCQENRIEIFGWYQTSNELWCCWCDNGMIYVHLSSGKYELLIVVVWRLYEGHSKVTFWDQPIINVKPHEVNMCSEVEIKWSRRIFSWKLHGRWWWFQLICFHLKY